MIHLSFFRILYMYTHTHTHQRSTQVYCNIFTIAKAWTQPRSLSTDEWIKQMGYIYITVYVSNEMLSFEAKQIELVAVMLNEIIQRQKGKYHMNCLMWKLKNSDC